MDTIYSVFAYIDTIDADPIAMPPLRDTRQEMIADARAFLGDGSFTRVRLQLNYTDGQAPLYRDITSLNELATLPPELLPCAECGQDITADRVVGMRHVLNSFDWDHSARIPGSAPRVSIFDN